MSGDEVWVYMCVPKSTCLWVCGVHRYACMCVLCVGYEIECYCVQEQGIQCAYRVCVCTCIMCIMCVYMC